MAWRDKLVRDLGNLSVYDLSLVHTCMNILADELEMQVSEHSMKSGINRIACESAAIAAASATLLQPHGSLPQRLLQMILCLLLMRKPRRTGCEHTRSTFF